MLLAINSLENKTNTETIKTEINTPEKFSYEDLKVTNGIDAIFRWGRMREGTHLLFAGHL